MNFIKSLTIFLLTYTSAKTINTGDKIIQQQSNFMDLMDSASNMYQYLSPSQALMKMLENPSFKELAGASPFELNNITEIVDKDDGTNVASFDWDKIHEESQRLMEQNNVKDATGKSINDKWNELVKEAEQTGVLKSRGRKLEAVTGTAILVGVVAPIVAERTVDLVIEYVNWTIEAHKEVVNYDQIYSKIADVKELSSAATEKLNEAEKLKDAAKENIRTAFKVIKGSVFELFSELKGHYKLWEVKEMFPGDQYAAIRKRMEDMYLESAKATIVIFREGILSTKQNMDDAKEHVKEGQKIVDQVQVDLERDSKELKKNADGKSEDFKDFKVEQRAIAYGTCSAITAACFGNPACAVPCFATAAGILETKIAQYQAKYDKMWKDVKAARAQIALVLKRADKLDVSFDNCSTKIKMIEKQVDQWVRVTDEKGMIAITENKKQLDWFVDTLDHVHNDDKYQIDFV